jgi:hypothetical protein
LLRRLHRLEGGLIGRLGELRMSASRMRGPPRRFPTPMLMAWSFPALRKLRIVPREHRSIAMASAMVQTGSGSMDAPS